MSRRSSRLDSGPRDDGNFSLFAGLIKCGECGKALTIRKTNAKSPKDIYACVTYNRYGKHHCTQHRIEYDVLYDMVLSKIQECAAAALADDDEVLDQLSESIRSEQESQMQAISRQVTKDTERLSLLDKMVVKLYEDMIAGKISESNFNLMMKKAQDEQAELNDRVRHNNELLGDQGKLTRDNQQWQDMIREYADIQELDAETLQKLIREIIVHETIDEDGTRNITAEIHFNLKPLPEPMGDSEPTTEYNMHEQAGSLMDGSLMDCSCAEKTPPPANC